MKEKRIMIVLGIAIFIMVISITSRFLSMHKEEVDLTSKRENQVNNLNEDLKVKSEDNIQSGEDKVEIENEIPAYLDFMKPYLSTYRIRQCYKELLEFLKKQEINEESLKSADTVVPDATENLIKFYIEILTDKQMIECSYHTQRKDMKFIVINQEKEEVQDQQYQPKESAGHEKEIIPEEKEEFLPTEEAKDVEEQQPTQSEPETEKIQPPENADNNNTQQENQEEINGQEGQTTTTTTTETIEVS